MDRRDFLKMVGLGTMTLFLSGCGLSVLAKEGSLATEKVSGGNKMKIVVINSSPHSEEESTSFVSKVRCGREKCRSRSICIRCGE